MGNLLRWLLRLLLGATLDRVLGPPAPRSAEEPFTHPPLPEPEPGRRWMRFPLLLVPVSLMVGGIFFISFGAVAIFAAQTHPVPQQPIPFDHSVHVQQVGLDCTYCHQTATTAPVAGMPSLQVCMDCHIVTPTGAGGPTSGLQYDWVKQQAVDWVRVWRMPDHVRFDHSVHMQAGLTCSDCHGDVQKMHTVAQGFPMKMQDCVACHQKMNAPTDCETCHY